MVVRWKCAIDALFVEAKLKDCLDSMGLIFSFVAVPTVVGQDDFKRKKKDKNTLKLQSILVVN